MQNKEECGNSSTPSADEVEEFVPAAEDAQNRGLCPILSSSSRHGILGPSARHALRPSVADSRVAREADSFIASILNDISAGRIETVSPQPPRTRNGGNRSALDSWENYMDKPVVWINASPSSAPTPKAVVQWFSFVPPEIPSPELSSDYIASSPSHISDSFGTSRDDSPPSVPNTVPEGVSNGTGGSTEDGSIESGRPTRREGSAIW